MAPLKLRKLLLIGGVTAIFAVGVPAVEAEKTSLADSITVVGEPETERMWSLAPAPENGLQQGKRVRKGDRGMSATDGRVRRDGPNCPDGEGCFWRETDFNGNKISVDGNSSTCCSWRYVSDFEDWWRSAKNRYGNRKLELGTQYNVIACINAGGERDDPGIYDRARIGSSGSNC